MRPVKHVSNDRPIYHRRRRLDASPMYHIIIDVAEHSTYFSDNAGDQWFFELRLQLNGTSDMHIFLEKRKFVEDIFIDSARNNKIFHFEFQMMCQTKN